MSSARSAKNKTRPHGNYVAPPRTANASLPGADHGLGMGMGMGMDLASETLFGDSNAIYSSLGGALVEQHAWKDYVYLVDFIRWMTDNDEWKTCDAVFSDENFLTSLNIDEESEIKLLLRMQRARTDEIVDAIAWQASDYLPLFEEVAQFDAFTHPNLFKLIQIVDFCAYAVVMQYKHKFRRIRPSIVNARIEPVIKVPSHPSFPSGHATQAAAVAEALKHVIKMAVSYDEVSDVNDVDVRFKNSRAIMLQRISAIAEQIAINREFAGVHYRSDSTYGQQLGKSVWKLFKRYVQKTSGHTSGDKNKHHINANILFNAKSDWRDKTLEYVPINGSKSDAKKSERETDVTLKT